MAPATKTSGGCSLPTRKIVKKKKSTKSGITTISLKRSNTVQSGDAVSGPDADLIAVGIKEYFDNKDGDDSEHEYNGGTDDDFGNDKDTNKVAEHTPVGKMCFNIHDFCYLFEFLFKYLSEQILKYLFELFLFVYPQALQTWHTL